MTTKTNKANLDNACNILGKVAKQVASSAAHAAIFAFVSKKVSSWMEKQSDKTANEKVRIEDTTTPPTDPTNAEPPTTCCNHNG